MGGFGEGGAGRKPVCREKSAGLLGAWDGEVSLGLRV